MTEEEFVALARSQWQALNSVKEEKNFYDYEKKFDEVWTNLGQQVLEKSISQVPKDRRKKKV